MNIRKHWKKILLTTTALFWASCTSENDNVFPTIGQDTSSAVDPGISSDSNIESSSENTVASSSSEASAPSSNSITQSSSSEANPSSSSDGNKPYRLASDPSVTCIQDFINGGKCLDEEDAKSNKEAIQRKIDEYKKAVEENQTLTLEQLDSLEEKTIANVKEWMDADYKAYRTSNSHCIHRDPGTPIYKCSNNETYDATTLVTDYTEKLIYTKEAHKAKFPEKYQSSSSTEPSSSGSVTSPSPLCQKSDFTATKDSLYAALEKDKKELIESAMKANGTSLRAKDTLCFERMQNYYVMSDVPLEILAQKQTCDGETTVNPRYQKELDSNKLFIQNLIDKCIQYSKIDQTACDLETMCPDYGIELRCSHNYRCEDGAFCWESDQNGTTSFSCSEGTDKTVNYTEDEFEMKYYVKERSNPLLPKT